VTRGTLEKRRFNLGSTSREDRAGGRACRAGEARLIIAPCPSLAVHPACRWGAPIAFRTLDRSAHV